METIGDRYVIRLARPDDALRISLLYHRVYNGKYSDPLMRNVDQLSSFLMHPANAWVVAEDNHDLVTSVAWETDGRNRLAKVFGGAVLPAHRGAGLLERAMKFGSDYLESRPEPVAVIYATTRTATTAPQIITEKLGYKKLGIFPNVHKTSTFETHCLTALFIGNALEKRFTKFKLHPKVAGFYRIAQAELGLADLPIAAAAEYVPIAPAKRMPLPELEVLEAPLFAIQRFRKLQEEQQIGFHFYPFHEPNLVILSPCQTVEVFLFRSPSDPYSTVVGVRKPDDIDSAEMLLRVSDLLRERGVRYLETIGRVDRPRILDGIIRAGFVPCAYFPAFQLHGEWRYDYAVFSKTFEMLDFRELKLTGTNQKLLQEYFLNWREIFLGPLYDKP